MHLRLSSCVFSVVSSKMKRKCEEKETPLRMKSRVKAMADTEDGSGRELIEFEWDMELPRCFPTLVEHISSVLIPDLARMVAEYATQPVCEAFGESIRLESDEHDYLHNSGYFRPIYEFATLLGIKRGEEDDCGNGPCNCLPRSIVFDILGKRLCLTHLFPGFVTALIHERHRCERMVTGSSGDPCGQGRSVLVLEQGVVRNDGWRQPANGVKESIYER